MVNKEAALLIEEGGIFPDNRSIVFHSLGDFLAAPDPLDLQPRRPGFLASIRGDSGYMVLSSEGVPWSQQQTHGYRDGDLMHRQMFAIFQEGATNNGFAKAQKADNQAVPTAIMLVLALASVFLLVVFGILALGERFG